MRKEAVIRITEEGRDHGKEFFIREMAASQTEKWAYRALQAAVRAGADIPDDIAKAGAAGIAVMGIQALAGMNFGDAEALLDEMFACISFIPDPRYPDVKRGLIEDDIEEVQTRIRLRKEVIGLHVNFSLPGAPSISTSTAPESPSSNTPMSPERSVRPSPRGALRL